MVSAVVLRVLPGAILVGAFGMAIVILMTFPSRSGLAGLAAEAESLATRENDLMLRMSVLRPGEGATPILPPDLLWQSDGSTSVNVVLQQVLVDAAGEAGLQLVSFGAAPPVDGLTLPTITYELELSGGHDSAARFLATVESMRPALAVSYLWLRQLPPDQSRAGSPISIRMTVWGFLNATEDSP